MWTRVFALTLAGIVVAGCTQSTHESGVPGGQGSGAQGPGVSANEIRVGVVASATNPLGTDYSRIADGAMAYFAMVNAGGGIRGRRLVVASERDDQAVMNKAEVQAILDRDNVFAVFIATLLFTGAEELVAAKVPTFGWNINAEWSKSPNLFGDKGSFFSFNGPIPLAPWLARKIGAKKIGIIAYNVPQSASCAQGDRASFAKFGGAQVVFNDTSLPFGTTDLSSDAAVMQRRGVDFVLACIDQNGVVSLARALHKQGLTVPLYLPNAYDHDFVSHYRDLLEGSYVLTQFVPFEAEPRPAGLAQFMEWMNKTGAKPTEVALAGWISADMLVTGIRAAGNDFTRAKVVDALNRLDHYTANGIVRPIDWTVEHTGNPKHMCFALLQIARGNFQPRFGAAGKPFVCFDRDANALPDEPNLGP